MTEPKPIFYSLFMLAFLIGCIVSINIPVLQEIIEPWHDDGTYSHGYLLLLISGYIFWRNREFLQYPATKLNVPAVGVFVLLCATWLAARVMGIEVLYRPLMPLFLLNLFYFVLTPKAATKFAFPSLLLLYAIPFWGLLSGLLQIISAEVVTVMVQSIGINVFLDGIFISIQAGTFEVAGGCSGIRYLLVTLTLSSIYSYFYYKDMASRVKLMLVAIVLSLITNWIRIVILVLIGHYTDMQHEMLADHNNLGWVIFFVLMIPLRLYADRLAKNEVDSDLKSTGINYIKGPLAKNTISVISISVITVILMGLLLSKGKNDDNPNTGVETIIVNNDWSATKYKTSFNPVFIEANGSDTTYVNKTTKEYLQLSIYRYKNIVGEVDLTDYRNRPIPKGWQVEQSEKEVVSTAQGDLTVIVSEITNNRVNMISLRVNQIGSQFTVSGLKSKLLKLLAWVKDEKYSGTFIVTMKCKNSCDEQRENIKSFIANNIEPLESFINPK